MVVSLCHCVGRSRQCHMLPWIGAFLVAMTWAFCRPEGLACRTVPLQTWPHKRVARRCFAVHDAASSVVNFIVRSVLQHWRPTFIRCFCVWVVLSPCLAKRCLRSKACSRRRAERIADVMVADEAGLVRRAAGMVVGAVCWCVLRRCGLCVTRTGAHWCKFRQLDRFHPCIPSTKGVWSASATSARLLRSV